MNIEVPMYNPLNLYLLFHLLACVSMPRNAKRIHVTYFNFGDMSTRATIYGMD